MVDKPLRIAIISKDDARRGGAGRVAVNLSSMLAKHTEYTIHHWIAVTDQRASYHRPLHKNKTCSFIYKCFRGLSQRVGAADFFTPEMFFSDLFRRRYDIYHFHSVVTALSPIAFRYIAKQSNIAVTLHDCSPFTGGCLHPTLTGCKKFQDQCGQCDQLNLWPLYGGLDLTGWMQDYKKNTAKLYPYAVITPSHWLANEAVKANFFRDKPVIIPNSVDTHVFVPLNKSNVRLELGFPEDHFIILLASNALDSPYKGIDYAIQAINSLKKDKILVLAIGEKNAIAEASLPIVFTGKLTQDNLMAKYFSAADLLLMPSIAEAFGNVAIEAMACGTAAVAFATGGLSEIIDHKENGWLAEPKDVNALQAGIEFAMNQPDILRHWQKQARIKVEKEYDQIRFLNSHLNLYHKLLLGH